MLDFMWLSDDTGLEDAGLCRCKSLQSQRLEQNHKCAPGARVVVSNEGPCAEIRAAQMRPTAGPPAPRKLLPGACTVQNVPELSQGVMWGIQHGRLATWREGAGERLRGLWTPSRQ